MNLPLAGSSGETQPSQQNIYMKSVSESQVSAMDSLSEKLGMRVPEILTLFVPEILAA